MRAFHLPETAFRRLLIGILLIVPAIALWNVYANAYGKRTINIGRKLSGVVEQAKPVSFSLQTFADGSWQKAVNAAVTNAIPTRPILIRTSNNIRVAMFGRYGDDQVVVGDKGHLIEKFYLNEYCARDIAALKAKAPAWVAQIKELQDFYRTQGKIFVYVLTPSKAAHFPELFVHRAPCASSETSRKEWLPVYTAFLRQAGVNFVDTASLIHSLKGQYPLDLFPVGGVHWNQIGVARAAEILIAEINRQGFTPPLPKPVWNYTISEVATGLDRDLLDLVNVLLPNPRYPTAAVTYNNSAGCPAYKRPLEIAFIGGSFADPPARVLNQNGCLPDLKRYNYLYRGMRGGDGYKSIKARATAEDIIPLRKADIVILEENEAVIPASDHAQEFYRVILGKK